MTVENLTVNWLSRYAGIEDCFAFDGVNYSDPDGISRIGSTADVFNAFFVAHLIGKDDVIIISETNYTQLKAINKNHDINLDDVGYVYSITDYCYIDCLEITCLNKCVEKDLYTQGCKDDACFLDTLIETNSTECGYDPCEGKICEPFCEGFDYYTSECDPLTGECVNTLLEINSVEHCGYIPEEPKKSSTPWWMLGFLLLLKRDDKDK